MRALKVWALFGLLTFATSAGAGEFDSLFRLLGGPIGKYVVMDTVAGRELAERVFVAAGRGAEERSAEGLAKLLKNPELRPLARDVQARLGVVEEAIHAAPPGTSVQGVVESVVDEAFALTRARGGIEFVREAPSTGRYARAAERFRSGITSGKALAAATKRAESMEGAFLQGLHAAGVRLKAGSRFSRAAMSFVNLSGAQANTAVFDGANLSFADLEGASLRGASFDGADLRLANFRDARLENADLSGAHLNGADFTGARINLNTLRLSGMTPAKARELGMVLDIEFKDPLTERLIGLLDRPLNEADTARLQAKWQELTGRAEQLDWNKMVRLKPGDPGYKRARRAIEALTAGRLEPSGTLKGENGAVKGTDGRAIARRNWDDCEKLVQGWVRDKSALTLERVRELNRTLGKDLLNNGRAPGNYRDFEIHGSGKRYLALADVEAAMDDFIAWYRASRKTMPPVELASRAYQRLVTIHPFPDANGRTSRAVMDWIFQIHGLPPATFATQEEAFVSLYGSQSDAQVYAASRASDVGTTGLERSMKLLEMTQ